MIDDYFDKLAIWLSFNDVILLNVFTNIERKPSSVIDTIGLNTLSSIPALEYNEEWLSRCSYEQFEFIVVNELFKLLLKHPTSRLADPKEVSALASNITVTELTTPDIIKEEFSAESFGFEPNLNFEAYWRLIKDELPSMEEVGDGFSEGDGVLKDYLDPTNNSNDGWGENELVEEVLSNIVEDAKNNTKAWGKITGKLYDEITAAYTLEIDPMLVLRRFKASINSLDTLPSRMKLNRRYGLSLPGRRRKKRSKVLVAIDVSGSMSNSMIADGVGLINTILNKANIEFLTFDTSITSEIMSSSKQIRSLGAKGRGGTNISCVLDYVMLSRNKYDGLIVYSDNYYQQVHTQPRNIKCLWFGCTGATDSPQSYGLHLKLDDIKN